MRVAVICPLYPPLPGGLADYTARWAEQLVAEPGWEADVLTGPGTEGPNAGPLRVHPGRTAWGPASGLVEQVQALKPDVVVVQYVPHLYQRRGLSFGIVRSVVAMAEAKLPVVLAMHELYYGRHEAFRHQPIGLVQRALLRPLFEASRAAVFSVPDRLRRMREVFPGYAGRFALIPVGANLFVPPDADPAAWRAARGFAPDELLLLFQGGLHPSKEVGSVVKALDALGQAGIAARLIAIGGGKLDHPRAVALGHLSAHEAGVALAAADMAVQPYDDGASGRRGSVANALAAGLPVVSTWGPNTDATLLPEGALRLVPAGDAAAFAAAVVDLARDPAARAALGAAGKAIHDAKLAWPVLLAAWRPILEQATAGR